MKLRGILLLALALICAPAMAQDGQGTAPLTVQKGGTGAGTPSGARTNLGVGTLGTQNSNAVAITGGTITGLPTPTNATDAAIKSYVDNATAGLTVLAPSALATAAVLPNTPTYANGTLGVGATLTAGANSTLTVDGTVATLNTVVLVKDQATAFQNGIYTVTTAGSGSVAWVLTRATYFNTSANMLLGSYTLITGGTVNANSSFVLQANVTTVGATAVSFNQFSLPSVSSIAGLAGAWSLNYPFGNTGSALNYVGPTTSGYLAYVSAGALQFKPNNGDMIRIAGVVYQIPSAGAAGCGNTGVFVNGTGSSNLAASTLYYVYLFNNSGTLTCDFSVTSYVWDTTAGNVGTAIETGDASRSLIGLIATNASSQFSDSVTARLTRSWFNRKSIALKSNVLAANTLIHLTTPAEVSTTLRVQFVIFDKEVSNFQCSCQAYSGNLNALALFYIEYDGTTLANPSYLNTSNNTGAAEANPAFDNSQISEGVHYATLYGSASAGSTNARLGSYLLGTVER